MRTNKGQAVSAAGEPDLYPLLFEPVYKDYVWGGTRIPDLFHRPPQPGICAESWEVSDRPEGMSIVRNGVHADKSLHELVLTMGRELIGPKASDVFPLLVKLIDARERLSVQVHPDDRSAARYGGEPKTEMWHVLDACPGTKLFAGLVHGVNRKALEKALNDQRLENVLQPVPAEPGTSLFIPGGRVHAIGEGCLLLEVQQNSNTTYRVYDWGRVGKDGAPRALHRKEAFRCINWRDRTVPAAVPVRCPSTGVNRWWELVACPYFRVSRVDLDGPEEVLSDVSKFDVLFVLGGQIRVETDGGSEVMGLGTSCLIPAALPGYRLIPLSATASVIRIQP